MIKMRLSRIQKEYLQFYKKNEGKTYQEASIMLNKGQSTIHKQVSKLVERGFLEKDSGGKVHYKKELIEKVKYRAVELMDRLEEYGFECEGGKLEEYKDWQVLKEFIYLLN